MASWTFFSNHAHALVAIAANPEIRIRDLAAAIGITERAAQRIVTDLVEDGYLARERIGRRNRYEIHADRPLRHPLEESHTIGEVLDVVGRSHA